VIDWCRFAQVFAGGEYNGHGRPAADELRKSIAIERQCKVGLCRLLVLPVAVVADRGDNRRNPDLAEPVLDPGLATRAPTFVRRSRFNIPFHDALSIVSLFGTNRPSRAAVAW
jgi:hypothetical protein